jgi:hypothetical protein
MFAGCAMPTGEKAGEEIKSHAEALNLTANFKLGLMDIRYDCPTCSPLKGPVVETRAVHDIALGAPGVTNWSTLPYGLTNPTGVRIALTRLPEGFSLQTVDFRLGIQAFDTGDAHGSSRFTTPWASDGGGWSDGACDAGDRIDADSFAIDIEVRPWPSTNTNQLRDFKVGLSARESRIVNGFHYCDFMLGEAQWTPKKLMDLAVNEPTWSHTASNLGGTAIDGAAIGLAVTF